jgi:hypothetical protein
MCRSRRVTADSTQSAKLMADGRLCDVAPATIAARIAPIAYL